MASDRPLFLRPIEYVQTGTSFTYNIGAGGVAKTCDNGVYANVLTLWKQVETQINHAGCTVSFSSDFKAVIAHAGGTIAITWNDTTLRDILGFAGDLAAAASHTAPYTPQYTWFPTYGHSDQNIWATTADEAFTGQTTRDGRVYGISSVAPLYHLEMEMPLEPAENVYRAAAVAATDADRSLEAFIIGSRSSWPTVSTNPPPHGFYYFRDYTEAMTPAATYGSGGVQFDLSSSPNTYCYAHFDSDMKKQYTTALPVGRLRYNIALSAHTATAPTWTADGT